MSLSWFQKTQPNLKQVVLKKKNWKKNKEEKKTIKNHNQKALNKPFNATIILLQTKCIYHTTYRWNIMCQKWEGDCGLLVLNEIIKKTWKFEKKNVEAVWELPAK